MSSPPGECRERLPDYSEIKGLVRGALIPILILGLRLGGGCSGTFTDDARAGTRAPLPEVSDSGLTPDLAASAEPNVNGPGHVTSTRDTHPISDSHQSKGATR